jgi:opacity protein-like surface antigen
MDKKKYLRAGSLLLLFSGVVSAENKNTLFTTLSLGPAWYQAGKTQSIELQSDFTNTYVAQPTTQSLLNGEIFLGMQHPWMPTCLAQFGLAASSNTPADTQGVVWEMADPMFDNFTYQYKVQHTQVMLKGVLLSEAVSSVFLPYVSAAIGVGFNRAYDFTLSSTIFAAIPPPNFQPNTQTVLTYALGTGVQQVLNSHWHVGLGYEFSDWGSNDLSPAPGQTSSQGLLMNHIYSNQLKFSLSYFA